MTEKVPKVIPTYYDVGPGNYFRSYPIFKGYYADGTIEGEHIQMEVKNPEEIQNKLFDYCTKAHISHLNKASNFEVIALELKEKGLRKLIKDLGEGDKK